MATCLVAMYGDEEPEKEDITSELELLTTLSKYEVCSSSQIAFDKIFEDQMDEATVDLLQITTKKRAQLVNTLSYSGAKPDPRNLLAASSQYFPTIWQLTNSLEAAGDTNINMSAPAKFSWSSVLDKRDRSNMWTQCVFVFELVEVLAHTSFAQWSVAANRAREGPAGKTDAVKSLLVTAGTLDYAATELIPRWRGLDAKTMPPEVQQPVLRCLSTLALAQAQMCKIAYALEAGKLTAPLLAKLYMGMAKLLGDCAAHVRGLDQESFAQLGSDLLEYLGTYPLIAKSQAYCHAAKDHMAKEEYGIATAYAQFAGNCCRDLKPFHSDLLRDHQVHLHSCYDHPTHTMTTNTLRPPHYL